MRVNIYAEEMPKTNRVSVVEKSGFTGIRFNLQLPVSMIRSHGGLAQRPATAQDRDQAVHIQGPFIHHPGDDDSSAVTFWGKHDLRVALREALELLDDYYAERDARVKADVIVAA